jgi:hypothetical protein
LSAQVADGYVLVDVNLAMIADSIGVHSIDLVITWDLDVLYLDWDSSVIPEIGECTCEPDGWDAPVCGWDPAVLAGSPVTVPADWITPIVTSAAPMRLNLAFSCVESNATANGSIATIRFSVHDDAAVGESLITANLVSAFRVYNDFDIESVTFEVGEVVFVVE